MKQATTMADIARLAGISTSAVSLALNGRAGVSSQTRERVTRLAESLGWHPNVAARALSGRPVAAVGLVLSRPARFLGVEPFYMSFLTGLENQFSKLGTSLLLHIAESREEEIATYHRWAAERRVDGLVLLDLTVNDPRPDIVRSLGLPTVVVGDPRYASGLPTIWTGDADAVQSAVVRLVELGHEHLAWVGERSELAHTRIRTQAFLAACADAQLPAPRIVETDSSADAGRDATRILLARPQPPTAIVYDNDLMAVAALAAVRNLGLSVPQNVSLIAYDDSLLCQVTSPTLTALSHDVHAYGAHAAQHLLRELQAPGSATDELNATPALIERESLAAPGLPQPIY